MRYDEGYAVMLKERFGEPEREIGSSKDLAEAQHIANQHTWARIVRTWKEGGIWHWGDETISRSFFWPKPLAAPQTRA